MEHLPFLDDYPIKTPFIYIYIGFRIAIFDYRWYFHEFGMLERPNPPLGPRCPFCLSKLTTSSIITFPHFPKMDKEAIATKKKSNRQNKNQILGVNWCKLNRLYPFFWGLLHIFPPKKSWTPGAALVPGHWQVAAPAATATQGDKGEPSGGSVCSIAIIWMWVKMEDLRDHKC